MSSAVLLDIKDGAGSKRPALEAELPGRSVHDAVAGDAYQAEDIGYAIVWKPTPNILASLPNLKVIFSLGAGVDHVVNDDTIPDLPLVRFVDPDLTGRMVEWVVLQVLTHLRQHERYRQMQDRREWVELDQPRAQDFTVGIMGLGELGLACADVLKALGFALTGWSRSSKSVVGMNTFEGDKERDAFLAATDILVGLLPLTGETRHLFDRSLFEILSRKGPFGAPIFINAGRGGSQVGSDIDACLRDGTLAAASLDVFEIEPLPDRDPLWTAPNLIITPHVAAVSDAEALARYVAGQIKTLEAGGPLENLVHRSRGY